VLEVAVKKKLGSFSLDMWFFASGRTITALFGPSGSGKTSVVNMIAGLLRPDRGRIALNGTTWFDSDRRMDLAPERRQVGCVFQDGRLFPHMSVRANLAYGMARAAFTERLVDFDAVVDLLGIGHLLERRPAKLSGGEKQRVAIGRALLSGPRLLLMDEPLASLDGARKAELLPFIAGLPNKFSVPIIYVTHVAEEVTALAETVVLLDSGRIVANGRTGEITKSVEFCGVVGLERRYVYKATAEGREAILKSPA
jgi:molybdate transport system ATP-binding protein